MVPEANSHHLGGDRKTYNGHEMSGSGISTSKTNTTSNNNNNNLKKQQPSYEKWTHPERSAGAITSIPRIISQDDEDVDLDDDELQRNDDAAPSNGLHVYDYNYSYYDDNDDHDHDDDDVDPSEALDEWTEFADSVSRSVPGFEQGTEVTHEEYMQNAALGGMALLSSSSGVATKGGAKLKRGGVGQRLTRLIHRFPTNNNSSTNSSSSSTTTTTASGGRLLPVRGGGGGGGAVATTSSSTFKRPAQLQRRRSSGHRSTFSGNRSTGSSLSTVSRGSAAAAAAADSQSVNSEFATTQSVDGVQSVITTLTIASHDETVKVSNISEKLLERTASSSDVDDPTRKGSSGKRWNKFKRMIGVTKGQSAEIESDLRADVMVDRTANHSFVRNSSNINDSPIRRQCSSDEAAALYKKAPRSDGRNDNKGCKFILPKRVRSSPETKTLEEKEKFDLSIRGRLDGLDVLSLGSAQCVSLPQHPDYPDMPSKLPWDDFPTHSFIGAAAHQSPAQMVTDMLWASAGRQPPEIILEGSIPGGNDRWSVRLESSEFRKDTIGQQPSQSQGQLTSSSSNTNKQSIYRNVSTNGISSQPLSSTDRYSPGPPALRLSETEDGDPSDDGSPTLPPRDLWRTLWGSDPEPANLTSLERAYQISHVDPLLHLAAECSIPIDVDENTFIVCSREHLRSIHEIVASELALGNFQRAILILRKVLSGFVSSHDEDELRFVKGATYHNIAIIQMWQGNFERAAANFHCAMNERIRVLPKDHPDIAVSMIRKGLALFALERFDEAISLMESALIKIPDNQLVRAKVLNNIGVIHYQQRNFISALQYFTRSLEIQRHWLESSVRRDCIVYDASITLGNMGKLYLERSDYDLAYFVYEEALLLQTTVFRKDHDIVLNSLTNMAITKARDGHAKKALPLLQACLRSQNQRFGVGSAPAMETIGLMGYLYARIQEFNDAAVCLTTVRKWQKTYLPAGHPALRQTKEFIKVMEESVGHEASVWV